MPLSIANAIRSKLQGVKEIWQFDNRWHLLASRTLFPRDPVMIYRIGPVEVLVDHSAGDANGARNVLASPMYREHLRHMDIGAPLKVLDIGANNGGFALLLRLEKLPLAKIVGVELNPSTCVRLRFNMERNLKCDHRVINAALCGIPRELELELGRGSVADSIYEPSHNADGLTVRVQGMTLDEIYLASFAGEIVDICKIDVEQAEYEVFDAPRHESIEHCRYVIIEIHDRPGRRHEEVIEAIVRRGFVALPQGSDPSVYSFKNERLVPGSIASTSKRDSPPAP
jgi:FkbM family methyltransferase